MENLVCKTIHSRHGAVLMYVVMALTVIAAVCISITLMATSLYKRTSSKTADEQAYLLAKSVGQCFVGADNYSVRGIVDYLTKKPNERVTARCTVYYDPKTMAASTNVNKQYLTTLAVTDAFLSFYLSEDKRFLYGDVTVSYNGATSSATMVMTCNNVAGFDRNMKAVFDEYDVFATAPNGLSFDMTSTSAPSVNLYNDKSTAATYTVNQDINANLTMTGPYIVTAPAPKSLNGDVSVYGNLQLLQNLQLTAGDNAAMYVNGDLVVGSENTFSNVRIDREVYCVSSVTVYSMPSDTQKTITKTIYTQSSVTINNAIVSGICSTTGTITLNNATVDSISTQGEVVLNNSRVTGTVAAGKLTVYNSSIMGDVTVQGSGLATGGTIIPNGDMLVVVDQEAVANCQIGTGINSCVYVGGNLTMQRLSATYLSTLYGTVEVAGGVAAPKENNSDKRELYPTTIYGNLLVHGGIRYYSTVGTTMFTESYNFSSLAYLQVRRYAATFGGDVVMDWAVPNFGQYFVPFASYSGYKNPDPSGSCTIEGTLFVCTNGRRSDELAGSFSYFNNDLFDDVFLNGAVLNNVVVGSDQQYGDLRVWGGTITGNIVAHNVSLIWVTTGDSPDQTITAKVSDGTAGDVVMATMWIRTDGMQSQSTKKEIVHATHYADMDLKYFGGKLDASGTLYLYPGVELTSTSQVKAYGAELYGVCSGLMAVGTRSAGGASATVYETARLTGNDHEHALYVNGSIQINAQTEGVGWVHVTEAVTINDYGGCPFGQLYYYKENAVRSTTPYYSRCIYAGEEGTSDVGTSLGKPYTVLDKATHPNTAQVEYVNVNTSTVQGSRAHAETPSPRIGLMSAVATAATDGQLDKQIVVNDDPDKVLFVAADCAVGAIYSEGPLLIKAGAKLTVMGNLVCSFVESVPFDWNYFETNAFDMVDEAGVEYTAKDLVVYGSVQLRAELASVLLQSVCINGHCKINTIGDVSVSSCTISGTLWCGNAAQLTVHDSTVGTVYCGNVYATETRFDNLYSHGESVKLLRCSFRYNSTHKAYLAAPNARVEMGNTTGPMYLCAKSVASDFWPTNTVEGSRIYILGGTDSELAYVDSVVTRVYAIDCTVKTNNFINKVDLYADGTAKFIYNGQILTPQDITTYWSNYQQCRDEVESLRSQIGYVMENVSNMGTLSGDVVKGYEDLVMPASHYEEPDGVSGKVSYTNINNIPQLSAAFWTAQALPLKWVFPTEDDTNRAATVAGEIVQLNPTSENSLMSVAYKSFSLQNSASAYGATFWQGLKDLAKRVLTSGDIFGAANNFRAGLVDIINNLRQVDSLCYATGLTSSPDSLMRYQCTKYSSTVKDWRKKDGVDADMLVVSQNYLDANGMTLYDVITGRDFGTWLDSIESGNWFIQAVAAILLAINDVISDVLQWIVNRFPEEFVKTLRQTPFSMFNWRWQSRPCGVFFFNSGYVPEEVFSSYADSTHSPTSAARGPSGYRSNYDDNERDEEGRWIWGGGSVLKNADGELQVGGSMGATGSAASCTWTFFTCADPANPYTSAAKDLHIVLPKHTYFTWVQNNQNCVRIIGNGRVFLYLQEDTNIKFVGARTGSQNSEQFGGLRYVRTATDADGKASTVYKTNAAGQNTGVYLDETNTSKRELQPRMFVVGTGPHIKFEVQDFTMAAYVYMPNGAKYANAKDYARIAFGKEDRDSGDVSAGRGYYNRFIVSCNPSLENATSNIYGIYVADVTKTYGAANFKVQYQGTAVDLSNTVIYYGKNKVTNKRTDAMYRLAEFWSYPDGMPTADFPWYYHGMMVK